MMRKMREKLYVAFFFIVSISIENSFGKEHSNKTKLIANADKKHHNIKDTKSIGRTKRSLDDDERLLSPNSGISKLFEDQNYGLIYDDYEDNEKIQKSYKLDKASPFWGNRGRRDSSSLENFSAMDPSSIQIMPSNNKHFSMNCEHCFKPSRHDEYLKHRRDEVISPFWGNRGRRSSGKIDSDNLPPSPYWANRGRRQEKDPFWGTRGRRQDDPDTTFWGSRGRRREEKEPFWGNRGRREDSELFWGNRGKKGDSEPFWGSRGRREDSKPFWGIQGRRQESEPFWGNRGRRTKSELFAKYQSKPKNLKDYIQRAINAVENNIEFLSRLRRSSTGSLNSFWTSRGRESQLKYLFNDPKFKTHAPSFKNEDFHRGINVRPSESSTVLDHRIYAEQPNFILVERNSRSSAEEDPFVISRGKKKIINLEMFKAARDRRGAIEELVKSVKNDPYYLARGKKDADNNITIGNSTVLRDQFDKAKKLFCATVDLIMIKNQDSKAKREIDDNDRDRRTILKKLAAQLQIDPYFVSRGKKDEDSDITEDNLEDFINDIYEKCN